MTDTSAPTRLSRRRLLTEGAVAGGVALAAASCAMNDPDPMSPKDRAVEVARVDQVPADDPHSRNWKYGYAMRIELDGQLMANPQRPTPSQPYLTVQAIHDGNRIGFRIEWEDPDESNSTSHVNWFRDGVAVLLAPGAGDEALRTMGSKDTPATILQWKADWQRQVNGDMQWIPQAFPNTAVDYYPPLYQTKPKDVTPKSYEEAKASQWLPGMAVGNPNAATARTSSIEKLTAHSFGTLASCPTQNCSGRGTYADGRWVATLSKPLTATDPDELSLSPGSAYTCAFAMWTGSQGDSGSKKSPSKTAHTLVLAS